MSPTPDLEDGIVASSPRGCEFNSRASIRYPRLRERARAFEEEYAIFKWNDKLRLLLMRFNFVLWSMITTNVSTSRLRDWKKKVGREEHAITQEYIKLASFPSFSSRILLLHQIETTHESDAQKKSSEPKFNGILACELCWRNWRRLW